MKTWEDIYKSFEWELIKFLVDRLINTPVKNYTTYVCRFHDYEIELYYAVFSHNKDLQVYKHIINTLPKTYRSHIHKIISEIGYICEAKDALNTLYRISSLNLELPQLRHLVTTDEEYGLLSKFIYDL